ncbi:branched-chain amino acid ABC transporter permease [Bradyrhizobium sp. U87765 SZCCT0131]|uniref:branched-chain amino acid ABC transporter permease n=1 Tax=unclassified Bradyrhizobium TaxID=2631580 RepID=UPI001BAC4312|nr:MULTISPECIES: branched-chain amino acid ABC transporter permease [unclassified Bradyrhizobium]MBR1221571.1 branched-chain amino acid ABC transporter permease [Bradyrhizobium sp. U87765 SZCCT0131]MBR1264506.1 branched-chain amino acid ABC transporter permease [Bradyrhizobium sp. U87765 SZCCT0134]MBR1304587.1 branched-chain amino acid ABC transporter permease [Bradyrhizobium sp. U87765 SZCCT0110]MBR1322556.1 branched-chain amino acid ABC transporter permease [Bradyrhizobium sp. U87765 SZCCT010
MLVLEILVQALMLGGLYALFAAGLALVFGVMRTVNLAHGDFIVLAGFASLVVTWTVPVHPFLSLLVVVPAMSSFGYLLQRGLLNRVVGRDPMAALLVTFGMSIILQNALLQVFSGDTRKLQAGAIETASLSVGGTAIGIYPIIVAVTALAVIGLLQLVFYRLAIGRVLRATSDDPETVRLMGVNHNNVYALASAIAFAVIAIAGVLMAVRTNFDPTLGPARLLTAFEVVIIGGLGSFWGALAGGLVLGLAQALGARIDPGVQMLAGHVVFLAVLLLRPNGLFPKVLQA